MKTTRRQRRGGDLVDRILRLLRKDRRRLWGRTELAAHLQISEAYLRNSVLPNPRLDPVRRPTGRNHVYGFAPAPRAETVVQRLQRLLDESDEVYDRCEFAALLRLSSSSIKHYTQERIMDRYHAVIDGHLYFGNPAALENFRNQLNA